MPVPASLNDYDIYIPEEEIYVIKGVAKMISTNKIPTKDDYYLLDRKYDSKDVPKELGGDKDPGDIEIPVWVYSPAAPIFIFGIGGLLCLALMGFFASRK